MKTLYESNSLEKLGINMLTGEACAFSMRVLCDVNDEGKALIEDFLCMAATSSNWNSQVNGKPAVASFMLHRDMLAPLVVFALFREGYRYVVQDKDWWYCTALNDEDLERNPLWKEQLDCPEIWGKRLFINPKAASTAPSVGSRNMHAFSGRVE